MSGRHRRERQNDPRRDQMDAAVRESQRALWANAEWMGVIPIQSDDNDPSDPFIASLLAQLRQMETDRTLRICQHLASPQPASLHLWDRPWTLRCIRCQMQRPKLSKVEDNTCDQCGQYDPTGVWPAHVQKGPVAIFFGRCDDCQPPHLRRGSKGH